MDDSTISTLVFYVNGKKVIEKCADPETTLLSYLRTKLFLTGSKLGCGEGGCGACTVMLSKYNRQNNTIQHHAVNACLAPLCAMHGLAVTTVEGIGSTAQKIHPVQERLARAHGSQCGFCTPGIVMSMYTLLRNNPQPPETDLEKTFQGNLCRCTGYRPIIEGYRTFTKEYVCGMGDKCCKLTGNNPIDDMETSLVDKSAFLPYDPSQEPIFPSELQLNHTYDDESLVFHGERTMWYRPTNLEQLLQLKTKYPHSKLVSGNTEIGVEIKLKKQLYPVLICTSHVTELVHLYTDDLYVHIGAGTTLTEIQERLTHLIQTMPEYQTRGLSAIVEMLHWFAGNQIRNVASIGGNIMTASPISDLNPLLQAMGAELTLTSQGSVERSVMLDSTFFTAYRTTVVREEEVLLSVAIPFTKKSEFIYGYKQAQRREDDISIVCAGMRVQLDADLVVKDAALSFGGMASTTVMATNTCKEIIGRVWNGECLEVGVSGLSREMSLPAGVPGGMEAYRQTLVLSFFYRFYNTVTSMVDSSSQWDESSVGVRQGAICTGVQIIQPPKQVNGSHDVIGRPIVHSSALQQATGEAVYCDDMPPFQGELYLCLVTSTEAHARIVSVDAAAALDMPGVVDFVSAKDVPKNRAGAVEKDEEVFASDSVFYHGQAIGAILADSQVHAQRAASKVNIVYEKRKSVVTIQEAIDADSFHTEAKPLYNGDVIQGFKESDHVVEGEVHMGGQQHFYLETQCAIAVPRDSGEVECFASSQSASEAQDWVADALGIPQHKVVVRVKRLGGGFGGKQTNFRLLLTPTAVAAMKCGRPVRCMLDRDEDMAITGNRHGFLAKYKVGFSSSGQLIAAKVDIYSNGGYSLDLSEAVLEKALFTAGNCYQFDNFLVTGRVCRTNLPSNTAFRGFGGVQGIFIAETMMDHVASALGVAKYKFREEALLSDGCKSHYGVVMKDVTIEKCWETCKQDSDFINRKKKVDQFNSCNQYKKRGIAITPVMFGISFLEAFLNQAACLINIYKDGSVLLALSGTEMGQGLYIKMIQVCSRELGIPTDRIHISETSTQTVPNMSPSAASASSDLIGMAIINACDVLKKRLQPFIDAKPDDTWEQWVNDAYFSLVSLSTTGFYRWSNLGWDWEKNSGHPYTYYSYGVSCSEVEVDCLTGDHWVLRTDIVMDVGQSLNPAIDIGQIEGGFVQGYGLFTMEENKVSPDGVLHSRGPGMYKIPGFTDIPEQLNVTLLKDSHNKKAVYSSKAIGEPPLILATSVFFAIKDALYAVKRSFQSRQQINGIEKGVNNRDGHIMENGIENGLDTSNNKCSESSNGHFRLDSPATSERIRLACPDQYRVSDPVFIKTRPWNVPV